MNSETRTMFKNTVAPGENSVSNIKETNTDISQKRVGPDSRLALNARKQPGVNMGRPMIVVDSPDGQVEAVVMSDATTDIHPGVARNPGYVTPSHVYAWEYGTAYTSSDTGTDINVKFNRRISTYANLFYYFHCHMLVKLVCKLPLDRSDRFYVNWNYGNAKPGTTGVGFEWAPIEKNEIYVLLPWSNPAPLAYTQTTLDKMVSDLFGYLTLKPIGSNGGVVVVNSYSSPVNLKLYNVKRSENSAVSCKLPEIPKYFSIDSKTTVDIGPDPVSLLVHTATNGTGAESSDRKVWIPSKRPFSAAVNGVFKDLRIFGATGTITGYVFPQDQMSAFPVQTQYESLIKVTKNSIIPAGVYSAALTKITNNAAKITDGMGSIVAQTTAGGEVVNLGVITMPKDGKLSSNNPDDFEFALVPLNQVPLPPKVVINEDDLAEEQMDSSLNTSEKPGEKGSDPSLDEKIGHTPDMKPETINDKILGKNTTESVRETNQYYLLTTVSMADSTPVEAKLNFPNNMIINFARHRLWTKYPQLKLVATQTIQNPARYRIVQIPQFDSLKYNPSDLFEMPGVEWDPKDGDLDLTLYWDRFPTAFFVDPKQTIQQNMTSFVPRIVIQPINNFGNAVPINIFARVDNSSYSAIKAIPDLAEEQGLFDELHPKLTRTKNALKGAMFPPEKEVGMAFCCSNNCGLTLNRACKYCNDPKSCKKYCETDPKYNVNCFDHHFNPYFKDDDPRYKTLMLRSYNLAFGVWCDQNNNNHVEWINIGCNEDYDVIKNRLWYAVNMKAHCNIPDQDNHCQCKPVGGNTYKWHRDYNRDHWRKGSTRSLQPVVMSDAEEQIDQNPSGESKNKKKSKPRSFRIKNVSRFSKCMPACYRAARADFDDRFYGDDDSAEEQINEAERVIPGDQFQSRLGSLTADEGANSVAKTYAFVDTVTSVVDATDPTPSFSIPINANTLGPYVRQEARRHVLWRGNVKFKILVNTPRTIAGAVTVAHVDEDFATQPTLYEIRQYPHQTSLDNNIVELMCGWRRENPWIKYDDNNGYLYISFEGVQFTGSTTLSFTIYVDSSGVEFVRPQSLATLPTSNVRKVLNKFEHPLIDLSFEAVERSMSDLDVSLATVVSMYEAGLYWDGSFMRCPTCQIRLSWWEEQDIPITEHWRHSGAEFSKCSLIKDRMKQGFPKRRLGEQAHKIKAPVFKGPEEDDSLC
ncbi:hypothetical protein 2 [Beihai picorna-like virus 115]|uniref:hypothetical protein 2 n=1 Tax=Beihai picorna-like virus 115 TaxID=1922544 RepID=UPI000909B05C|nr:hypothetical protein 2 [Beihai picorna-like virus 115]APG76768.1 hypothetical protein 2 [Beihai picorna-like virus 115]